MSNSFSNTLVMDSTRYGDPMSRGRASMNSGDPYVDFAYGVDLSEPTPKKKKSSAIKLMDKDLKMALLLLYVKYHRPINK